MPKINVYVPQWLAEAIKESDVTVSTVCQRALEDAIKATSRAAGQAERASTREIERVFTNRARQVLRDARSQVANGDFCADLVLLDALEREGGNLALVVLRSLGLKRGGDSWSADAGLAGGELQNLDWLLDRAATEATDMGNDYIGCEHLLLAIVSDIDGPAAQALAREGADPARIRQATRTAAAAAAFGRSRSAGVVVSDAVSGALEEIRARLGRLEQR